MFGTADGQSPRTSLLLLDLDGLPTVSVDDIPCEYTEWSRISLAEVRVPSGRASANVLSPSSPFSPAASVTSVASPSAEAFYCGLCKKKFLSEATWETHKKSSKHLKEQKKSRQSCDSSSSMMSTPRKMTPSSKMTPSRDSKLAKLVVEAEEARRNHNRDSVQDRCAAAKLYLKCGKQHAESSLPVDSVQYFLASMRILSTDKHVAWLASDNSSDDDDGLNSVRQSRTSMRLYMLSALYLSRIVRPYLRLVSLHLVMHVLSNFVGVEHFQRFGSLVSPAGVNLCELDALVKECCSGLQERKRNELLALAGGGVSKPAAENAGGNEKKQASFGCLIDLLEEVEHVSSRLSGEGATESLLASLLAAHLNHLEGNHVKSSNCYCSAANRALDPSTRAGLVVLAFEALATTANPEYLHALLDLASEALESALRGNDVVRCGLLHRRFTDHFIGLTKAPVGSLNSGDCADSEWRLAFLLHLARARARHDAQALDDVAHWVTHPHLTGGDAGRAGGPARGGSQPKGRSGKQTLAQLFDLVHSQLYASGRY